MTEFRQIYGGGLSTSDALEEIINMYGKTEGIPVSAICAKVQALSSSFQGITLNELRAALTIPAVPTKIRERAPEVLNIPYPQLTSYLRNIEKAIYGKEIGQPPSLAKQKRTRCYTCGSDGHISNVCPEAKNKKAPLASASAMSEPSTSPPFKVDHSTARHPRGTRPDGNRRKRCYGCGKLDHTILTCPDCKGVRPANPVFNVEFGEGDDIIAYYSEDDSNVDAGEADDDNVLASIEPATVAASEHDNKTLVQCTILGTQQTAMLDSGATFSHGSKQLYDLCIANKIALVPDYADYILANGQMVQGCRYRAEIPVTLNNKCIVVTFVLFASHSSRILLGLNFLAKANITMEFKDPHWHFASSPTVKYTYAQPQQAAVIAPKVSLDVPKLHTKPLMDYENENGDYKDYVEDEYNDPPNSPYCLAIDPVGFTAITDEELQLRPDEGVNLSPAQRKQLQEFLIEFRDIFGMPKQLTTAATHQIILRGQTGRFRRLQHFSPSRTNVLNELVTDLVNKGFIVPTEAPRAACPVLVKKPNGKFRLTIDYRPVNKDTEDDSHPLPRIDDLLALGSGSKYFSVVDLANGFWQIVVDQDSQVHTAFQTPFGLYKWTRMPQGLKNAPATFQRMMHHVLEGLQYSTCLAYLDDTLIKGQTFEEHLQNLREVFQRFQKFNLGLGREKCQFCPATLTFLGHVINEDGIRPKNNKLEAVSAYPEPKNVKQLKLFLGLVSWYRRHIGNLSDLAAPLNQLTRDKVRWNFDDTCRDAFQRIKNALIEAPSLIAPDYNKPFIIRTDASLIALGAALIQLNEEGKERIVKFANRSLLDAETRYSTIERECLAVVWAVRRWHHYVEDEHFTIVTDHAPLKGLFEKTAPTPRLTNWALALQQYKFTLEYRRGVENYVADALSRRGEVLAIESTRATIAGFPTIPPRRIREWQLADSTLESIITSLENDEDDVWGEQGFMMVNRVLHRTAHPTIKKDFVLVVPESMKNDVLYLLHSSPEGGHGGADRTLHRLRQNFYWSSMRKDVNDYVKACTECQRFKPSNQKPPGLLGNSFTPNRWEMLAIDLVGPLPISDRFEYILSVEDVATRYIEFLPLESPNAGAIAKKLVKEIFFRFGLPKTIISDNGTQFTSALMANICSLLGINLHTIPLYHPQANPVERVHRDLKIQIAMNIGAIHSNWHTVLPMAGFVLRSMVNETTGQTPAYLMFGREPRNTATILYDVTPVQLTDMHISVKRFAEQMKHIWSQCQEAIEMAKEKQRKNYDEQHRLGPQYKVGDKVWVQKPILSDAKHKFTAKLAPKKIGPFIILKVLNPITFSIGECDTGALYGRYHIKNLAPFIEEPDAHLSQMAIKTPITLMDQKGLNKTAKKMRKKYLHEIHQQMQQRVSKRSETFPEAVLHRSTTITNLAVPELKVDNSNPEGTPPRQQVNKPKRLRY